MDGAFEAPRPMAISDGFGVIPIRRRAKVVWTSRFRAVFRFATGWALIAIVVLIARLMAGQ
jgi:hypothetical protein